MRASTSEQLYLSGCLGLYGDADPLRIARVSEAMPWLVPFEEPPAQQVVAPEVPRGSRKTERFAPPGKGPRQFGRRLSRPREVAGTQPHSVDLVTDPHHRTSGHFPSSRRQALSDGVDP